MMKRSNNFATEFANKVAELESYPAEIQSLWKEHRNSPSVAVKNVQECMTKLRDERKKVKRVDPQCMIQLGNS
jgi:hypothetical protein